ncbi:hypothetical protein LWI29_016628 [Acer saccharum]|uniref:Uncharacterized protein n=1 Tax=Acer saccharum TaxID=4024 RepID=A0AA39VGM5_ACESA|nr:hypothetical protein LWI29_016628 [Acer saccharum]
MESEISEEDSAQIEEASSETDLQNYWLARDREKRQVRPPDRFGYADLIAFAFTAAEAFIDEEPRSYVEAIKSKEARKWKLFHSWFEAMLLLSSPHFHGKKAIATLGAAGSLK